MLMWEVSSGQPPFIDYEHDYDLAMNIVNEEQEAFHSKSYKFYIPDNVSDFDKSNSQKNNTSKVYNILKDTQNDYKIETIEKKTKILSINDNDEDEIYNNPNFHSEEQDEFELPDSI
ncbi:uncharacterized protein OCT59_002456 [Rhizophagus irregularis]|uniref:uncharacterized protein n=1 Tax=Rhizophagus irregularis TaxID=588596 RepID=UPI00332583FF|nr:hypothetical protein OCT59_002456 [Rhizophagus irregularis]